MQNDGLKFQATTTTETTTTTTTDTTTSKRSIHVNCPYLIMFKLPPRVFRQLQVSEAIYSGEMTCVFIF